MCSNRQFSANLFTFTKKILNGKLNFLSSVAAVVNLLFKIFVEKLSFNGNAENIGKNNK